MPIKSITLGNNTVASNLIQGPLAGYSCAPFRELVWQYSQPAYCCTEMISAKDLVNRPWQNNRYTIVSKHEGPVCFQLSGNDPLTIGKACQLVTDLGASFIDLNCGCPKPKIRMKGTGSKLLENPPLIQAMVTAMKDSTDVPISIKIRVDGGSKDQNNLSVIEAAQRGGVDFIVVHGRHWQEDYDTACCLEQIADIVKCAQVPIIANGDVKDAESCRRVFDETACDGIMISRASVGKPWLFQQIEAQLNGLDFNEPSLEDIKKLYLSHIRKLAELENERPAVLQSRSLAKYYFRDVVSDKTYFEKLYKAESIMQLDAILAYHQGVEN